MIDRVSKITIYVNDQEEAKKFWVQKCKFMIREETKMGDMTWLEVAPQQNASTSFVLYDKRMMEKTNSDINTKHPSIILSTSNVDETVKQLTENGVKMGEIMNLPYGKMVQFQDQDNNDYLLREN